MAQENPGSNKTFSNFEQEDIWVNHRYVVGWYCILKKSRLGAHINE